LTPPGTTVERIEAPEAPEFRCPSTETPSLDDLARDYGRLVSSICRRMIRDEETARDAAQQVWVDISRGYPAFRGEAKVSTWIYTIARRVALAHSRSEQVASLKFLRDYALTVEVQQPAGRGAEQVLWVKESCDRCVTGILHCVDNETRLAHILRDIAGLEYREIALILEKHEAAVRQMISRSRRRTSAFLRDRCAIFNPHGDCRCRMTHLVAGLDLTREYRKIRAVVRHAHFVRHAETLFPPKDFWLGLL
jgi:RNA polymerase sigma-70 factor (ECF subfamily)